MLTNVLNKQKILFSFREIFAIVYLVFNLFMAVVFLIRRVQGKTSISHQLLAILAGNLVIYLLYYTIVKTFLEFKDKVMKRNLDTNPSYNRQDSSAKTRAALLICKHPKGNAYCLL